VLRLQDDIYSLFNLELTGNEELLTSPSITASLLSERERALSFLNLQIALSSSKPEKLLELRSRMFNVWSCQNDLGMCPLNRFSLKSRTTKPEVDVLNC